MPSISKILLLFLVMCIHAPNSVFASNVFLKNVQVIQGGLANSFNRNTGNSNINVVAGKKKATEQPAQPLNPLANIGDGGSNPPNKPSNIDTTLTPAVSEPTPPEPQGASGATVCTAIPTNAQSSGPASGPASGASSGDSAQPPNSGQNNGAPLRSVLAGGNLFEKRVYSIQGGTANSMNENQGNSFINVQSTDE